MKLKYNRKTFKTGFAILMATLLLGACDKVKNEPVEVYPESPVAKVKFADAIPSPSIGSPGSEVVFQVTGLEGKTGRFTFFINQTEAEVLEVTSETVTVRVPATASTGGSSVLIDGEYYFGPTFVIRGKVSIDPAFNPASSKSNGEIISIREFTGDQYVATGSFSDYQNQATSDKKVPGMVKLDKNTLGYNNTGSETSQFNVGKKGITGMVTTVVPVADGKYLVAGSFTQYDTVDNVNSIVRIYAGGNLDSVKVDVIGEPPLDQMTVPAFNGGVGGPILKVFYNSSTKDVTVIGNFNNYVNTFYERSSIGGLLFDYVEMGQVMRMKENGELDSTFNFNEAEEKGYPGGNGFVYDAIQLSNGDYLLAGNFTNYNGSPANHLVRLSGTDGSVVTSFTASADGVINKLIKNTETGNIVVSGNFKTFNGQAANQVAIINESGNIVPGFTMKQTDGLVNYAGQLKNGKIIVSGNFTKYNGIIREGLAILNPDGSLADGYNSFGLFRGQVNGHIESPTAAGQPGVILYGLFDKFDNKEVGNIVKIRIED